MGEDVGKLGGVFANTQGLLEEFGAPRVIDTPISETAFIGAAVGMATSGMRPIVELMFVDFVGVCMNSIYNLAAKNCYFSGGSMPVPMVLMTSVGGGYGDAAQHSQCLYATFGHLPGLKVVIPSNAYDAKGLMIAAIRNPNPVVFMFHKALQGVGWLGTVQSSIAHVPEEPYEVPLSRAAIVRRGADVTVVGLGATVHYAIESAAMLEKEGVDVEIVDLRSIAPLDRATIVESVRRTRRLVTVDDDYHSYGVGAEVIASVAETPGLRLAAAPVRVCFPDIPVPFTPVMERFVMPSSEKISAAIRAALHGSDHGG
jgi:pyruvate dehydrogenase E1 component beta subunit